MNNFQLREFDTSMRGDSPRNSLNPDELETVACALCGSEDHAKVFDAEDIRYGVPGVFTLVRCCDCGLVFMNPRYRKEFLGRLYPEGYEPHKVYGDDATGREARAGMQAGRYRILEGVQKYPGILLDVGSGAGDFLNYTEKRGWNTHGVEPDEEACAGQKRLGLKVHNGELTELDLGEGVFDVVTFWDVFEHVPNPVETLRKANRVLKDGGAVIMSLPNFDSVERRIFGPKWFRLDTPRYLYHYAPETVRGMLEKTGFTVESITHSTTATALVASLRNVLGRKKNVREHEAVTQSESLPDSRGGGGLKGAVKRAVFFGAFVPFLQAMDRAGRGGHMIVIARKPRAARMDLHAPEPEAGEDG